MLKSSRTWQDELHDQICWRFSKYKFVVNETCVKFDRDLKYLQGYLEHTTFKSTSPTVDWQLPVDQEGLERIIDRILNIVDDLKSLKISLDQVTIMVPLYFIRSLRNRDTTTCR
jgi:hypothetical protein